jgi:hypothetical protein
MNSMSKLFVTVLLLILTVSVFTVKVTAQQTTDPYQEYVTTLNEYYKERAAFEQARNQYRAYKTAQAKEDTHDWAIRMFESGRKAMLMYTELVEASLRPQDEINSDVKTRILNDINAHKDYLQNVEPTIKETETEAQVKTMGDALNLRYNYVRFTTQQALKYMDTVTVRKQMNQERTIIETFISVIAGYPDTNRSRNIVSKWIADFQPAFTQDEVLLNKEVSDIYPVEGNNPIPLFERTNRIEGAQLPNLQLRLRQNGEKFREMLEVAKKAYQEL